MQCVILVGGLGTRLGALTASVPKPMLPVAGVPFLDRLVENVVRFGFDDILLLAGYRGDVVQRYFSTYHHRSRVRVLVEQQPLGTGGAIRAAAADLARNFLLLNGDTWFDFNLLDLAIGRHAGMRMALRLVPDASRFDVVDLEAGGRIAAMRTRSHVHAPGLINGGAYWVDRDTLLGVIPRANASSLEREALSALAAVGMLDGRVYEGAFVDIGIPSDLLRAQTQFPVRRGAVFFDRDGTLNYDPGYTYRIDTFRWISGAREAIRAVNDAGLFAFVVTNQSGVARGFYQEVDVEALHRWMGEDLRRMGAHVDAFAFCPHHPDGNVTGYDRPCRRRKPAPGMLADLMASWPVDPARSIVIGDSACDLSAASAAGILGALFSGGRLDEFLRCAAEDLLRPSITRSREGLLAADDRHNEAAGGAGH